MGVSCSGSSIVDLQLRELKLLGSLGNQLQHLHNLKNLDVSLNSLQGEIPFGLPPNATHINMAYNNLTQSIPFSLPLLTSLQSLNLSHNSLSGPLGNLFSGLQIKEWFPLSCRKIGFFSALVIPSKKMARMVKRKRRVVMKRKKRNRRVIRAIKRGPRILLPELTEKKYRSINLYNGL